MLDLFSNTLLQALTFGVGAVGIAIAFRVARYPDLTADGSFMLGSSVFAYAAPLTGFWPAFAISMLSGAAAGAATSMLNSWCGVSRLLSGILTTMIAYSLAFRFLGGHPNIGLPEETPSFSWALAALFAVVTIVVIRQLLNSDLGLLLRSTGSNPGLIADLGRSPFLYRALGLAVANGLVAAAAVLVSVQQGFVDINLGVGVVITLIAALVLGEELFNAFGTLQHRGQIRRAVAPFVGAAIFFLLYLLILKASIRGWIPVSVQPTDLKLLTAAVIVGVIALRRKRNPREDILPL